MNNCTTPNSQFYICLDPRLHLDPSPTYGCYQDYTWFPVQHVWIQDYTWFPVRQVAGTRTTPDSQSNICLDQRLHLVPSPTCVWIHDYTWFPVQHVAGTRNTPCSQSYTWLIPSLHLVPSQACGWNKDYIWFTVRHVAGTMTKPGSQSDVTGSKHTPGSQSGIHSNQNHPYKIVLVTNKKTRISRAVKYNLIVKNLTNTV